MGLTEGLVSFWKGRGTRRKIRIDLSVMACTGRLRPRGVPFFRPVAYERVGISLVEVRYMKG